MASSLLTSSNDLVLTFLRDRNSFRHAGLAVFGRSLRHYYAGDAVAVSPVEPVGSDLDMVQRHHIDVHSYCSLGSALYQSWRWLAYWLFLRDSPPGRRVVILDAHDVLVQRNPFFTPFSGELDSSPRSASSPAQYTAASAQFALVLGTEGVAYRDCEWNMQDMLRLQKACGPSGPCDFMDWPVINASLVAGPAELVRDWCLRVATFLLGVEQAGATDMAVTAMLCHRLLTPHPNRRLPIHLTTPRDRFVITGHHVRTELVGVPLTWNQDTCQLAGPAGTYTLFHQWDRTQYAPDILAKWGDWSQPDYGPMVISTYSLEALEQTKDKLRVEAKRP